jgi:hypothetical protein
MNFSVRQTAILVEDEFKQLWCRKRALFAIVLYVGMLFLFFWGLSRSREFLLNGLGGLPMDPRQKVMLEQSLRRFTIPRAAIERAPILSLPVPVLLYFLISLSSLPFLIPMVSCDMISLDLYRGTQRFLLFRVSRSAYFWSKTIAHFLVYLGIQAAVLAGLFLFCLFYAREALSWAFLFHALHLSLRLVPVIAVFLAFTQMISSRVANPVKSLIVSNLGLFAMVVLLAFQPRLSVFYPPLWSGLFAFEPATEFVKSAVGFAGWSVFFWGGSFALFWKRNL